MVRLFEVDEFRRRPRWWCGGVAGIVTSMVVFPLDLIETRMQILKHNISMSDTIKMAIKKNGFLSLYDGFSAAIVRQFTYTSIRFHLYETGKLYIDEKLFLNKILVAATAGFLAGFVGVPLDLCVVRMQSDRSLPEKLQRGYRSLSHVVTSTYKAEGIMGFYHGASFAFTRGALITIGQNAVYDQAKRFFMDKTKLKEDSKQIHLVSSIVAGFICAPLVHPIEIFKTVYMQRQVKDITFIKAFNFITRFGLVGVFRGFLPMSLRLIPSTVILFVSYEQLRIRFGYIPKNLTDVGYNAHSAINLIRETYD